MSDCDLKLNWKLELDTEIEAHLLVVIEEALDKSENLASYANKRLDELSCLDKEAQEIVHARPKLSYETFSGDIGQWLTFQQNQKELFKMFADKRADNGGASQQLYQLSKILSPELPKTVMSFSGAENGAAKAVAWLNLKFNSLHLLLPRVYQELWMWYPLKATPTCPRLRNDFCGKLRVFQRSWLVTKAHYPWTLHK